MMSKPAGANSIGSSSKVAIVVGANGGGEGGEVGSDAGGDGKARGGGDGDELGGGGVAGGGSVGNGGCDGIAGRTGLDDGPTEGAWRELEASGEYIRVDPLGELALTHGTHLNCGEGIDPVQDFALWPWQKHLRQRIRLVHVAVWCNIEKQL